MISQDLATHNARPIFLQIPRLAATALVGLIFLGITSGCGGQKDEQTAESEGKNQAVTSADCPASLDLSGWEAFVTLGDQLSAGQPASEDELAAFGNLPAITLWRESMIPRPPSAIKVGNWVEFAFWDQIGQGRTPKKNSDKTTYSKAMRYSYDQRQEIGPLLDRYRNEGHPCKVYDLASRWLEKKNIPDPLTIHFVAGKAELRSHYGQLIADTSVLLAGGIPQMDRQMAAILFRDRQALQGANPLEVNGAEAVTNVLRIMMNEGVAAWIEDMPSTHFDSSHPRLGKVSVIPEEIYKIGIRTISLFNVELPPMLENPERMEVGGEIFSRSIAGSGAFNQGGYCMASVIAHRLGEDRLVQVSKYPPAFLEAFQEAALQNTLPLPNPGQVGRQLYETMPALSNEVYLGLMELLEEAYPQP